MRNRVILFFMLLTVSLFPNRLQTSYAIQTDKDISPQAFIEHQETLFSYNSDLLREAITPNTTLWVKNITPDDNLDDPYLGSSVTKFEKNKESLYRIHNPSLTLLVDLESRSSTTHGSYIIAWIAGNAFYFGIISILIAYGWFIYSLVKHKTIQYYLYFHIVFIALLFVLDGWLEKIVLSNTLVARPYIIGLLIGLSAFLLIHFTRRFLATDISHKILDRTLYALAILNLISVVIFPFFPQGIALFYITTLGFASVILLLVSTLFVFLIGESLALRSHLVLWSMLLIMIGVEYLRRIDVLPSNLFTLLALKVMLIIELPIISTSILRYRFSHLEKESSEIETYKKESKEEIWRHEQDRKRLQQKHDLLNKLAGVDSLTGLYNRREFFNISDSHIFKSKTTFDPYALMMLDIDHFKNINDTYGHDVGDVVLKSVTDAISRQKRPDDVLGRVGGEEFALFMSNISASEAEKLANKICKSVRELIIDTNGNSIKITISIGVTSDAHRDLTLPELMKSSDEALYEAKNSGRNRAVVKIAR